MSAPRRRKPCPGCGQVSRSRAADEVCHDCKRLLQEATEHRKRTDAQAVAGELVIARMPWQFYSLPYLGFRDDSRPFQQAFLALAKAASEPCPGQHWDAPPLIPKQDNGTASDPENVRTFAPAVAEQLRRLYAATKALVDVAEASGKESGRSFIVGLATGDVSVDEFNRATAGKKLRKVK